MKKNNNPITIYWSPYYPITQMMSDWSFLYPKPKTLFSEFLHFLKQWEDRKNITLPDKVKDLLNAKD